MIHPKEPQAAEYAKEYDVSRYLARGEAGADQAGEPRYDLQLSRTARSRLAEELLSRIS